jgi:hypothetical protein
VYEGCSFGDLQGDYTKPNTNMEQSRNKITSRIKDTEFDLVNLGEYIQFNRTFNGIEMMVF